jgi:uncharacterized protein
LKYFPILSLFALLFVQPCNSQDTSVKASSRRPSINQEREDSLLLHIPQARGLINDFTGLFTDSEIRTLDSLVSTYENATTVEIAVATVDSGMVKKQDFEDYSLVMLNTWGVGKREKNNGILIVIAPGLRLIRVENGHGIEKFLSDAETKEIIDSAFIPKFKEGKFFEGTQNGIIAIMRKLKQNGL